MKSKRKSLGKRVKMSQTKLKKSELISYKNFALDLALGAGKILRRYEKEVVGYEVKDKDENMLELAAYSHLTEKELLDLINSLPDGYRVIFNLYVIEGFQHDEIAEMLGIQPGTSRSQLVKARNMLQRQILQLQKVAV